MIKASVVAAFLFGLSLTQAEVQAQGSGSGQAPLFTPETRALIEARIGGEDARSALLAFEASGGSAQTVVLLAKAGHRDAARLIGRRCLEQGFCDLTRQESHDLLAAAANTQAESAMALARIYRNGKWGGQAYPVSAAQWYAHAHKLGAPFAKVEIATLPRLSVIEAGAGDLLPPLVQMAEVPQSLPPLPQAPPPPQTQPQTQATGTDTAGSFTDEEIMAALDLWLGPDSSLPGMLTWPGRAEGFPVFADTRLDAAGDAAASCFVQALARLESNLAKAKAGTATPAERASLEVDKVNMDLYLSFAKTSAEGDGFSRQAMGGFLSTHQANARSYPGMGPDQAFCKANLIPFTTDVIVAMSEANGG